MRSSLILAAALMSACASLPAGPGPSEGELGAQLESIRSAHGLPALAAAVADSDHVIAIGAAGYRKTGDPTPVTVNDQWHLGSDTKAMTATLVGQQVESGTLKWDSTLEEIFSDWAPGMDPGYRKVTVRMLLAHRSGMPELSLPTLLKMKVDDRPASEVRNEAVRGLLSEPPRSTPGTTFAYSNAGYMAVGAVLERVTGMPWEKLIQERLFQPLGMASCGFGPPGTPDKVDQPWGHRSPSWLRRLFGGGPSPYGPEPYYDNPPAFGPAGTVHCTLQDWARFLAVHLKGARGEPSILSADTFKVLQTPWPGGDYALGWGTGSRPWAGGPILAHEGSNTFFLAAVFIAPAHNRIYMVVTNVFSDEADQAVNQSVHLMIKSEPKAIPLM